MKKLVSLLLLSLSGTVGAVDLSAPFICRDISPNKMYLSDNKLHVGGFTYNMHNENTSSIHAITNSQFLSEDQFTIIEIRQYSSSGEIEVSMMRLNAPYSLINPNHDLSKYKIKEVVSFDISESNDPKLIGGNQGCKNI
ncbi:hypothetical protein [Aeromonas sanarellii]|uniref:hypothetical protein n=1 Tax=Aeromonas sanarellii TaxID=633415 RepID=UPI0038CFFD0C